MPHPVISTLTDLHVLASPWFQASTCCTWWLRMRATALAAGCSCGQPEQMVLAPLQAAPCGLCLKPALGSRPPQVSVSPISRVCKLLSFPLLCLGSAGSNRCCGCHLLELLGSLCNACLLNGFGQPCDRVIHPLPLCLPPDIFSIRSGQATLAWSSSIYAGGRWGRTVLPRATAPIELVSRPFNVFAGGAPCNLWNPHAARFLWMQECDCS